MKFTLFVAAALIPLAGAFLQPVSAPRSALVLNGQSDDLLRAFWGKDPEPHHPQQEEQPDVSIDEHGNQIWYGQPESACNTQHFGGRYRDAGQAAALTGDPNREKYDRPFAVKRTEPDQRPEEDWHHLNW